MILKVKLYSCPFCANHEVSIRNYDPYDGYQGDCSRFIIKCEKCGAKIEDRNPTKLVNRWNTRIHSEIYRTTYIAVW